MSAISSILASEAKFKVLQVLCAQPHPISVRELADATHLTVKAIDRILIDFGHKKFVRGTLSEKSRCFEINPKHELAELIHTLFQTIRTFETQHNKNQSYIPKNEAFYHQSSLNLFRHVDA